MKIPHVLRKMFTIKQLEALYWVARLGGFESAANQLNVSQSAISKRIAEIEMRFAEPLFDRSGRQALMTNQGRDMLGIARQMLTLNEQLIAIARRKDPLPQRFAIGVTDLVALSWLPELLSELAQQYPDTMIEPEIDLTANLISRLQRREVDLTICPAFPDQTDFTHSELANIELSWLASPGLTGGRTRLSREEILDLTLLTQSQQSVMHDVLKPIVSSENLPFRKVLFCNNMAALAELASAGLGITLLPATFFRRHIESDRLVIVKSDIALPMLKYYVSYHSSYYSAFSESIRVLCQSICNFKS